MIATFATIVASLAAVAPTAARARETEPTWLALRAGAYARVDVALWATADEPEAALTASPASLASDLTADVSRPGDVVYEPVGVRVRIVRTFPGSHVVLVHGVDRRFEAYARVERVVAEIPAGTHLRAAGGFGGFADFYPTLATRSSRAERLATGSDLTALGLAAAPFDSGSADLVRVHVRVRTGNLRGREGFVAVAYVGLPAARVGAEGEVAERACRCRLVQFGSAP